MKIIILPISQCLVGVLSPDIFKNILNLYRGQDSVRHLGCRSNINIVDFYSGVERKNLTKVYPMYIRNFSERRVDPLKAMH